MMATIRVASCENALRFRIVELGRASAMVETVEGRSTAAQASDRRQPREKMKMAALNDGGRKNGGGRGGRLLVAALARSVRHYYTPLYMAMAISDE